MKSRIFLAMGCVLVTHLYVEQSAESAYVVAVGDGGTIRQTSDSGGNWFARASGTTAALNDVDCIGGSCWIAGSSGLILNSLDAGVTWTPQPSGTNADLHSVRFLTRQLGWAVGVGGTILSTINGGTTWGKVNLSPDDTFYDVEFVNTQTGWVVGGNGTVRHTIDGGANWSFQTSGISSVIQVVDFVDANNGWYFAHIAGRTANAGGTWVPNIGLNFNGPIFTSDFIDSQYGVVGGEGGIFVTSNGGTMWNPASVGTSATIFDISMLNNTVGWCVGELGTLRTSIDGGNNWTPQNIGTSAELRGISVFEIPILGDYNGDKIVDAADYQKWHSTFGSINDLSADGNNNGVIDAADYVVWRDSLPVGTIDSALNTIPEPSSILLSIFIAVYYMMPRRRVCGQ